MDLRMCMCVYSTSGTAYQKYHILHGKIVRAAMTPRGRMLYKTWLGIFILDPYTEMKKTWSWYTLLMVAFDTSH